MRFSWLPIVPIAALVTAGPIAAQTAPAEPGTATGGSLLAPRTTEAPPPPTPIAPEPAPQAAMPPSPVAPLPVAPLPVAPLPVGPSAIAPSPASAPDPNAITAVPLPPPGAIPPAPPASVATAPPAVTSGAATTLTPTPLTLPPPRTMSPAVDRAVPPTPSAGGTSGIVATLPTPPLSPEASPADFLRAARGAVAAGRTGEARSSLEMAQTRLLSRVVDAGKESVPSSNAAVKDISEALDALAANDRMGCLHYIEVASRTIGTPLD